MAFLLVVGVVASIVLTVLLCVKVLPNKYDGTFSKPVLQLAHDYFNFKKLYLEAVLKVIFAFLSITCVIVGVFAATVGNAVQLIGNIVDAINYEYMGAWIWRSFFMNLFGGIGIAVLGPIVLRLVYEGAMMFILLVKNVIDINNKMKAPAITEEQAEPVTVGTADSDQAL